MNKLTFFKVGEIYTNDQIRFSLDLENLGGIRPALDSNRNIRHVAVMTAAQDSGRLAAENPYHDRIEGSILIYTAQGREGDQVLAGRNKRLVEQYVVPTPFLGSLISGDRPIASSGCWNCCATTKKIKLTRTGLFAGCGCSSFAYMTNPISFPLRMHDRFLRPFWLSRAGTIRRPAWNVKSLPWPKARARLRPPRQQISKRSGCGYSSSHRTTLNISSNSYSNEVDSSGFP